MANQRVQSVRIVGAIFRHHAHIHLVEMASGPLRVILFDKNSSFAKGPAYATPNAKHLLNVRVANMSAYDSDADHFMRWLDRDQRCPVDPRSRHAFVSRGTYGRYLRATLEAACLTARSGAHVVEVAAEVADLRLGKGLLELTSTDGRQFDVGSLALCIGNFPPALPMEERTAPDQPDRYIAVPWAAHALDRISPQDSVALVRTRLDDGRCRPRSSVARSHGKRHGAVASRLSPRHRDVEPYAPFLPADRLPRTVSELLAAVRREVRSAAQRGVDWRSVIDALRPQTQSLWRNLPVPERKRFLRHVRPYWEVHRHRVAPAVADEIGALLQAGSLSVIAGRIASLGVEDSRFRLGVRHRATASTQLALIGW